MRTKDFLALDLGASSGRGILGQFDGETLRTKEAHRFEHHLCRVRSTAYWDILRLYQECLSAIAKSRSVSPELAGVGLIPGDWTTGCWTKTAIFWAM